MGLSCKSKPTVPKNPKIYVIGIDGADWDIIDPLIKQDKLSFFKKLKKESSWSRLKSFKPTLSAVIWTSIATGDTMVKHGIVDWLYVKENNITVPYSNAEKRVPSIWEIFSNFGKKSIVLHWYVTYPPDHINGVMVSDSFSEAMSTVFFRKENYKKFQDTVYPEIYYNKMYRLLKKDFRDNNIDYKGMIKYLEIPDYIEMYKTLYNEKTVKKIPILSNWRRYVFKDYIAEKTLYYFLRRSKFDMLLWYSRMPDVFKHFASIYMDKTYLDKINKLLDNKEPISRKIEKEFEAKLSTVVEPILKHKEKLLKTIYEKAKKENAYIIILSDHGFTLTKKGYDHHALPKGIKAPDGILMILGPDVKKNHEVKASVLDITPTILYMENKPIGKDMDGKPIIDAFRTRRKITFKLYKKGQIPKKKENKELNKEKLKDLKTIGYI
jgi:predicted AlkP superfamily phosphohydrolase/phosphomutase